MAISVTCQSTPDYLRFELSGARVEGRFAEQMIEVWRHVAQECHAHGFTRVLGISKLTGTVSRAALFQVGQVAPQLMHEAGCRRLAYVVLGGSEAVGALKFGEDVAVNRGQVARIFDDEPTAVAWLTSG